MNFDDQTLADVLKVAQNLPEDFAQHAVGGMAFGQISALLAAGARPQQAFRLAAFIAIDSTLGTEGLDALGLPKSTRNRWRAEVRALTDELTDDAALEVSRRYARLTGLSDE